MLYLIEILHQTTTLLRRIQAQPLLYLIEILHQTTTAEHEAKKKAELYLIEILHQTTTLSLKDFHDKSCILLKFYIKPQQLDVRFVLLYVVSYWNSTSNHNCRAS